jgi:hypothetical protein
MKKLLLFCVVAVALAAAAPARAASGLGLRGETGLARTPMAVALPPLTLAIAGDFIASDDVFLPLRAEFGVIDGLELGGNFWYIDSTAIAAAWGFNAKYVLPEFVENLGLALGGHYREQDLAVGNNNGHDVYFVASYRAGFLVPSLGIRYESITGANDESDARFFGSLVANVLPTLAIGAEIESPSNKLDGSGADPSMWFGARFLPLEGLTVQAGLLNRSDTGADHPLGTNAFVLHFGVQYAYSFMR